MTTINLSLSGQQGSVSVSGTSIDPEVIAASQKIIDALTASAKTQPR